jgi:hypothetical protein
MNIIRLYTDALGETHFVEMPVDFQITDYAPPAPALFTSTFATAQQTGFMRIEPGWYGDWHPVPRRQIQVFVAGELAAEASDGSKIHACPGTVVLVEDTSGKGHKSWVIGDKEVIIHVVVLPETA